MSKMDRQGVRTASDLERKYQFGKQFLEIMGIASDARSSVSKVESNLSNEILEQKTSITRDTQQIIMSALQSFTENEDLEEFKKTLTAELELWADNITGRVSSTESSIKDVDADLQEKFNTLAKYFSFTINGMEIGATYTDENGEEQQSPNKVIIDNDEISILVSGFPVQTFKADGTATIPSLSVTQTFDLLGLRITEDETHINCDYVGV